MPVVNLDRVPCGRLIAASFDNEKSFQNALNTRLRALHQPVQPRARVHLPLHGRQAAQGARSRVLLHVTPPALHVSVMLVAMAALAYLDRSSLSLRHIAGLSICSSVLLSLARINNIMRYSEPAGLYAHDLTSHSAPRSWCTGGMLRSWLQAVVTW